MTVGWLMDSDACWDLPRSVLACARPCWRIFDLGGSVCFDLSVLMVGICRGWLGDGGVRVLFVGLGAGVAGSWVEFLIERA